MASEIWRLSAVIAFTGQSRSSIYAAIPAGLFPPPIKITARAVGWCAEEVRALNGARIAGKSSDDIKALVASLVAVRALAA
jgi:prophage regulatory protein